MLPVATNKYTMILTASRAMWYLTSERFSAMAASCGLEDVFKAWRKLYSNIKERRREERREERRRNDGVRERKERNQKKRRKEEERRRNGEVREGKVKREEGYRKERRGEEKREEGWFGLERWKDNSMVTNTTSLQQHTYTYIRKYIHTHSYTRTDTAILNKFSPLLSYHIIFSPIKFSTFLFYPILSYPILSYPILSYPILSYPILSYPTIYYNIIFSP